MPSLLLREFHHVHHHSAAALFAATVVALPVAARLPGVSAVLPGGSRVSTRPSGAYRLLSLCQSWPSIRAFDFSFFSSTEWDTTKLQFGAAPFIAGTVLTSLIAMIIAVPLSVGAAT